MKWGSPMEELIKSLVPQFIMTAVVLAIFWVMRGDVLAIIARLEARVDKLIDALIDDDQSD